VPGGDVDAVARLRRLAALLDRVVTIPGTRISLGLDPLLGLIPGAGDLATGLLSVYIVARAARLGVPRATLVRMIGNVFVDVAGGSVPVIGDLFDVAWRSNLKNVEMLTRHVEQPTVVRRESRLVALLLVLVAAALVVAGIWLGVLALRWVVHALR